MALGFEQAGFDIVAGFDSEQRHVDTFQKNFPRGKAHCLDLAETTGATLRSLAEVGDRDIAVVFGGPPCQGFSLIGKRDENDPRNGLIFQFARLVGELRPRYFVMENVAGIRTVGEGSFVKRFIEAVRRAGYHVVDPPMVLNAADFGVPQNRRRLFLFGYRCDLQPPTYPEPVEATQLGDSGFDASGLRPKVRDAIGDLPNIRKFPELLKQHSVVAELGEASEYVQYLRYDRNDATDLSLPRTWDPSVLTASLRTEHRPESVRRFKKTKQGEYERQSRLYRLSLDGLCPTIRAGTGPENGSFMAARPIHPRQHRCITVREAARLHSFPDWFSFHATKWHGFRQVGNSVPPLLARAVAASITERIKR
jgi:DNA (cytosine-5)-methyltransferase 1